MSVNTFAFHLSPRGQLRWAIASLFIAVIPNTLAAGVVVAPGPGGTAQLQTQAGVPIVNIVAPNGAGLSHNQFLDYNVDRQGLVLNNALQAGQSQLAGQLAANPQLQGQAASVILNEVISRNPSAINGAQEIFGRAADYVLANPNGISVNGGSFINTPNANLVVGRPELQDGKLQGLSTRDASGQLQIQGGGLSNGEGSINLIAPRIDSQGSLTARDQLNLTAGRNQLDYASGQVTAVDPTGHSAEQRIDASLFGAMQAGRINIVSTAEGAGVKVGAVQVAGRDGVQIRSAGDLSVSGKAVADSLAATRAAILSSHGDVGLHSGQDLTLAATDVNARDVNLDARRNLTLSTVESRKLQEKRENWSNSTLGITWETYDRTQTERDTRQHGSQIVARRDAQLSAGKDAELKAAKVEAANTLNVHSAGDLRLTAATESHTRTDQGNQRKHLWKANWDNSSEEQRSVGSQLKGGNIALQTAALLRSEGAELSSAGDLHLAGQHVDIGTASRTSRSSDTRYSGDLVGGGFFGKNGDTDKGQTQHQGSKINAAGALVVKADDVRISASQVRGGQEASVISDHGSLLIDGVQDTSHSNSHATDSKFFGIAKDESRHKSTDSTTVRSELVSDSNLKLKSATDIAVAGATVKAGGALTLDAAGDVNVHSTQNRHDSSRTEQNRGFDLYARENASASEQYRAGLHFEDKSKTVTTSDVTQQGASLSGGTVQVQAGGDLTIKGGEVQSSAGDTSLGGRNVALLAEQDSHHAATEQRTTGGSLYVTGGLDRAGAGVDFAHATTQDSNGKTNAQTSAVHSSAGLTIKADTLTTEGAQLKAGTALDIAANAVDNRAASNTESSSQASSNWTADVGVNAEYKDVARPVVAVVKEALAGKLPDKEALGKMGQPTLGVDVAVGHAGSARSEQSSNAVVSRFDAGSVDVNVAGTLHDQGSQYNASAGQVHISADKLVADAASNSHGSSEKALDANVDVRVYTKTGEDLNIAGSGTGGSSQMRQDSATAVLGSYAGSQGVHINVGGDAQFEGSRFDGGQGGVSLKAGGELALNQANDRQSSDSSSLRGDASLKVGTLPGTDGSNLDLGAGVQLDHSVKHTEDSQARVASISGNGPVQLSSGGQQIQQGTKIDSAGVIDLQAAGGLDLQAASDSHLETGRQLGGGLKAGGSRTSGEKSLDKAGNLGGNFSIGRVDEKAQTGSGGQLHSQTGVALSGASVHLQGTQGTAPQINVDAQQGGVVAESAQSSEQRNNWNVALNAGGNLSSSTPTDTAEPASSDHGFNAGAKVGVDYLQGTTQQNSLLKADSVALNSAADAQLSGARLEAESVSGKVAGDLRVDSRQDTRTAAKVDVDLGLTAKKTPADKDKLAGTDYKPTLKAQGEYSRKDGVGQGSTIAGSNGVKLEVDGVTRLTGARISASGGPVDLGDSKVSSSDLNSRSDGFTAGVDLPHKSEGGVPPVSFANGNLSIGPVTVSGHSDSQTLQAGIDKKG
jgi:hemolysin